MGESRTTRYPCIGRSSFSPAPSSARPIFDQDGQPDLSTISLRHLEHRDRRLRRRGSPVRYLLEVLTADRSRFTDIRPIYAFVSSPSVDQDDLRRAEWIARGTVPLIYRGAGADHDALYSALAAWADYADGPTAWRSEQAKVILGTHPDLVTELTRGRLLWALGRGDAGRVLAEANPTAGWLPQLSARGLLDTAPPGLWMTKHLEDGEMIAACIDGPRIDDDLSVHH